MPKFIIERNISDAGSFTTEELHSISAKSCGVLREMGPTIQWVESYVTKDKIFCIYIAPNEETIREHALRGDFPIDNIFQINTIIDPTTAEK